MVILRGTFVGVICTELEVEKLDFVVVVVGLPGTGIVAAWHVDAKAKRRQREVERASLTMARREKLEVR